MNTANTPEFMVDVAGLRKQFKVRPESFTAKPKVVHAVSDISFKLEPGVTLGIVGESGCGKSTVARLLMGLIEADDGVVRRPLLFHRPHATHPLNPMPTHSHLPTIHSISPRAADPPTTRTTRDRAP